MALQLSILLSDIEHIAQKSSDNTVPKSWTRSQSISTVALFGCCGMLFLAPCFTILICITMEHFDGALSSALSAGVSKLSSIVPRPEWKHVLWLSLWLLFQATLFRFLPGRMITGQITPAGEIVSYRTNGLLALISTLCLAALICYCGVPPAWIANNWSALIVSANAYGFLLSTFVFAKAYAAPSNQGDCKFSGNLLYDFFMGIELNPRLWSHDIKFFHNGRHGMIGWMVVDLSFIALQYNMHGTVTDAILIAFFLHSIYIVDFLLNEGWYLKTIDIAHDHYGFCLAWGSSAWLPATYTLQTQYLARHPGKLMSTWASVALLLCGIIGYSIFRAVNHQKDAFRKANGECLVWGRKPQFIVANYTTADGGYHESLLLCSGWWGVVRHANYMGDLVLSWAMCATCGFTHLLPWTYFIFMVLILVHRCWRDEERCKAKYGVAWDQYCEKVRWRMVPCVY